MAYGHPQFSRRTFIGATAAVGLAAGSLGKASARHSPAIILTSWEFGPGANAVGWPILQKGGTAIDAVEAAVNYVELLPNVADVGFGGSPNEVGETTLDAMMMWGPTHDVGAVGCLKRIKRAISVARQVMEKTQHTLIVGDDATRFAAKMGFEESTLTNLASQREWEEWASKNKKSDAWDREPLRVSRRAPGRDTVGTIALDTEGNICVGCSTNGRAFKIPGRVGDSPIAGAGAYCDNDIGGAIATGNGDVMMRFLPTYHTVELMRSGRSPAEAAKSALKRIKQKGYLFDGAIIALRRDGRHGAAKAGWGTVPLTYAVQDQSGVRAFDR